LKTAKSYATAEKRQIIVIYFIKGSSMPPVFAHHPKIRNRGLR